MRSYTVTLAVDFDEDGPTDPAALALGVHRWLNPATTDPVTYTVTERCPRRPGEGGSVTIHRGAVVDAPIPPPLPRGST